MTQILKQWILQAWSALTFDKASKQMKLTRLIEKFDVIEASRLHSNVRR